ncbi:DUF7446 family protein [Mycolicibacterium septicum]|uniref:DUF7446 family protein n=1 Tax=Mycolicibacterium septicum TaxID=98668 RepID=UPI001AF7E451|nr:hypothetical protein [Mycolicibacterium septicum]QRY51789.1 hypothetical protein JVX95_31185 [Mycolicibacterium septicum]
MSDYSIRYNALDGKIYAGPSDKAGSVQDISGYAIWAVAEWLEAHDDGTPYEIFNSAGDRRGYRLTVEKLGDPGELW